MIVLVNDVPGTWRYVAPVGDGWYYLVPVSDAAKQLVSWWPGASISTRRQHIVIPTQKERLL